jgi:putative membrane-bound dehydrogenase-like protein
MIVSPSLRGGTLSRLTSFIFSVGVAWAAPLSVREDPSAGTLSIFRPQATRPILVQNAAANARPYLHPLVSPDGTSILTETNPAHHPHQTGIFWGLTRVNGRDYFHNAGAGYWRRVASRVLIASGEEVRWATDYELLGADGQAVLRETQTWSMRDHGDRYVIDFEWKGEALVDVTVDQFAYGGLFVRMPWRNGMDGAAVNSNRQRNARADAQRAVWLDVGLKLEGRSDLAHIAIFDHPLNPGYPLPWRVDGQLGVGPSPSQAAAWKIARGKSTSFRHQLVVHTGALDDNKVTDWWSAYSGQARDNVMWTLAREEGRRAQSLTAEQALAKMTVSPGFEVKLAASEPMITQPMAFCWDDRGRLWVAENRDYEARVRGFSASGDSRIVILEDTNGDGTFDTRKVFLEGIPFPAALAVGFDGLFLGAPPNLLFVPDRDHDDRADSNIQVRLTGWGIQDRHETLNSLTWGPDGWLYGCQGYATRSTVGKPTDGGRLFKQGDPFPTNLAIRDPQYIDGGVWRYHPTKDRFEIVAHGFSNPWGLDFDDHGQMFITACVIPHLWHVIPGGIYHRQGGRHINPHIYADIKTIADHRHRSAHGGARVYLADEFPRAYRGQIFMANIHERALLSDILEPRGSGFVGHHGEDVVLANDPQWVGFSLEVGPDGAIYILDWHDADICGISVQHKETGRIYRVAPPGLAGKAGLDLAAQSDLELVDLQSHRNDWYVRRARLQLQQRAAAGKLDPRVAPALWAQFERTASIPGLLRALWALHVTNHLPAERLLTLLDHPAPHLRAWAIQLLGEDRAPSSAALARFVTLAKSDPSPVVRLYLASAMQRVPAEQRWPIAAGLVTHAEDATDHNLPYLIWVGLEPMVPVDPTRALALVGDGALPLVTQFVARRATAEKQLAPVAAAIAAASSIRAQTALLEGLRDGLKSLGRREVSAPANWPAAESAIKSRGDATTRELATQIGQLFGDAKASAAQLAALRDAGTALPRRRDILQAFARDAYVPALPVMLGLLDEAALRRDAIAALAAFDDRRVAPELLRRYASWSAAEKADAILTLAARATTAGALFTELKKGTIPKRDISAFAARQLRQVIGPGFIDFWGPLAQPDDDKRAETMKLKLLLTDDTLARANLANGRAIFDRTCSACHMLYGAGGKIGPDITGSNRANLDYILNEILNPSEVIQEGYQLVTVTTRDGRTLAGNLAVEDAQQVTLRMIGQETTVAKSEILSREVSPVSMMPEGLLKTLTSEETRDLIAYLRTSQQVPITARP